MPEADGLLEMREHTKKVRADILDMIHLAGTGHPGGALSCVEILVALYFGVMRVRPDEPTWPERDRFVLSKGHAAPALYAVLMERGFFPRAELATFRRFGSMLQGHPDRNRTPGVEVSTGSLGQGFAVAVGMALAGKVRGRRHRVFTLLGDGECDEGLVWEAALWAAHRGLDNLTAVIDRNHLQLDGWTQDILNLNPLPEKWQAFGWQVEEVDGHDLGCLFEALDAPSAAGKPRMLIAETTKGKGVSYMEGKCEWHSGCPDDEQLSQALKEIKEA